SHTKFLTVPRRPGEVKGCVNAVRSAPCHRRSTLARNVPSTSRLTDRARVSVPGWSLAPAGGFRGRVVVGTFCDIRWAQQGTTRCFAVREDELAYWVLQCNPEHYRLRDALRDGFDVRSWRVVRYLQEMAPGDEAAMWISGAAAGVYALAEVTSSAERSAHEPD